MKLRACLKRLVRTIRCEIFSIPLNESALYQLFDRCEAELFQALLGRGTVDVQAVIRSILVDANEEKG